MEEKISGLASQLAEWFKELGLPGELKLPDASEMHQKTKEQMMLLNSQKEAFRKFCGLPEHDSEGIVYAPYMPLTTTVLPVVDVDGNLHDSQGPQGIPGPSCPKVDCDLLDTFHVHMTCDQTRFDYGE